MVITKEDPAKLSEIHTQCVAYNLQKTSRLVTSFFRDTISSSGLKGNQFPLLLAIKLWQPISITELSKSLNLDRTTLSRNLKLLEKKGYISLEQNSDHRIRNVLLSDEGEMKLKDAIPLWQKAQDKIIKEFGENEWNNLLNSLQTIANIVK